MIKLPYIPEQDGYTITPGQDTLRVDLDGGKGRYRKDIDGATLQVGVTWELNPIDYGRLYAAYRNLTASGSVPFLIDLVLDGTLQEHECHFMPGSFGLRSMEGFSYTCGATLEVTPVDITDLTVETEAFFLLSSLSPDPTTYLLLLEDLVNVRLEH